MTHDITDERLAEHGSDGCTFDRAWCGPCGKPLASGSDILCDEHLPLRCSSCGKQATRDCEYTGQFVCGFPLCVACGPVVDPNQADFGMFGMRHEHKPKISDAQAAGEEK